MDLLTRLDILNRTQSIHRRLYTYIIRKSETLSSCMFQNQSPRISSKNILLIKSILTHSFKYRDYYIWNVKWLSFNSIITVYVNRKQDKAVTVINDATTGYVVREKEYPTAPQSHNDAWFLPHGLLSSSIYNFYFQIWPYEGFKTIISFDTRVSY